ncbi:MAG: S41 family peptidase [Proteobacteria bacterium]|nr:S41 family peptidase [Pseudomonadota bacterium]MBU1710549.1 S41 family peptidase [Pseudomonadota bacterium]
MKFKTKPLVKKLIFTAALSVTIFSIIFWSHDSGVSARTQDTYKNLEAFSNVLSIIQKNYVEDVDTQQIIEGAIKGMLSSLDPHSSYMKPDDFKELKVETQGSFSGIGIEITMKDGILTVVSPIEGTPAFKKGLKAGDKIIKIGDETTSDLTLVQAVKKLRGPKGSNVTISIHRKGWTDLKEITIVRDDIPLQSVKSKMLEPGYGYLRIINFQSKTTTDFKKALKDLTNDNDIKGLVLDLRNNPGGLLDQAVKISDVFIDDGIIVSTKGRIKEQNMVFKAHSAGTSYDFPLVVLVNEGSASASEIVAGALQDHKKAIILGAQTFGKGSVQTIIPINNGAGLRLTTAKYYTPSGISIQAKGITPDIVVPTEVHNNREEPAASKKKPKFLREKDLKHHIENGNESEEGEPAEEDIEGKNSSDELEPAEDKNKKIIDDKDSEKSEEELIKESIEKDNQLRTALTLLKGLNVFGGLKTP